MDGSRGEGQGSCAAVAARSPDHLSPRLLSGGRLNAYGALTAETFAPKATLTPIGYITVVTTAFTIKIHYEDEDGIDLTSVTSTNIAIHP